MRAEIRVKDALIGNYDKRDKNLLKELKVLTAITRVPRMYTELRKAMERKEQSDRKMTVSKENDDPKVLSKTQQKVHSFFDYVCLVVNAG